MNTKTRFLLATLTLGASAWMLTAQDAGNPPRHQPPPPGREGPPGPGHPGHRPPPPPPVMMVLDANHDGVIDTQEIAGAAKALLQLDDNGDGKLTRDELMPPPPPEGEPGPDDDFGPGPR